MQGVQVWYLIRELRSYMLHKTNKKKTKQTKKKWDVTSEQKLHYSTFTFWVLRRDRGLQSGKQGGKNPDPGKDWRQEKWATEYEMVGWHHWLDGHEFEQTQGDSEGQASLGCCSSWGCKRVRHDLVAEQQPPQTGKVTVESVTVCLSALCLSFLKRNPGIITASASEDCWKN